MSNDFVRFSFPNIQEMCIDISSHKLQWKLSVDFSCLDGSMPHHHLKHLLGYTLAKDDGTGKSVPRHMAADGELAAKCQSDSLQILVVLLYAGNGWFVACPLEYLLCVGEDRHNKFLSSLDSARTDEGMAIKIDDMFRVAEFAGISESHTCEYLEQEKADQESKRRTNATFVACFSERCDSSAMWGYYSADHKGMCIGYDLRELIDKFGIMPVIYSEDLPLLEDV